MKKLMAVLLISSLSLWASSTTSWAATTHLLDSSKLQMFVDELPDMPRIRGYRFVNGNPKPTSLKIGMFKKKWKFHRDIPPTPVFAYGVDQDHATFPGPTIEAIESIETYVRWENHIHSKHILPWDPTIPTATPKQRNRVPTVVHLHGGIHEPQSDGNANAWYTADFREKGPTWSSETSHYHNQQQPGNLWYHDHAMGLTRVNLLAGLFGAFIIRQPRVERPLGLPYGDEFDRPLIVCDRSFRTDGSIYMNSTGNNPSIHPEWQPEYFGDAIVVNGKAWPYMRVRRRKYRFRIINASNARFFNFFLTNGLDFIIVGSDSAYIEKPILSKKFLLGPSEITDVIIDFSKSQGDTAVLANDAFYPYPSGDPVTDANGKVMKFLISADQEVDSSSIPKTLIQYLKPNEKTASLTRYIAMYEYTSASNEPTHLFLNGKPYDAPVTETPKEGSNEIWYVINLTEDNHPLHVHLGLFVVLDQIELQNLEEFKDCMSKKNDAVSCNLDKHLSGNRTEAVAHEKGWKNVYKMSPGVVTKIFVRFGYVHTNASYAFDPTAEPGYVYHCHILDHEDNAMMRPLKIVK